MPPLVFLRRLLQSTARKTSARPPAIPPIDFSAWDVSRLSQEWREAQPYSHVVIDDLVPEGTLAALRVAVEEEPHVPNRGEIFDMLGSAASAVTHPVLRAFHESLGSPEGLEAVAAVTGKPMNRVVMRSFIYLDGSYLLPHTDHRDDLGRQVAYAYYVSASGEGGELELFDCTLAGQEIVETRPGVRIPAVSNRLVLFDVTPGSLHQVREVIGGRRLSFSGWFYV